MELKSLVGENVLALIPRIDASVYQKVKLLGVESGGIWIESQHTTNQLLRFLGVQTAPKTLVIFFPYHEVAFVLSRLDVPSLDEKAFGV